MRSLPTLVVHGYLTPPLANLPVHLALRTRGIRSRDVPIPGLNTQDIARSAALVADEVERVLERTGATEVDLVGVSMGGMIAAHYVRCLGGHERVRRTVTLGTPFRGTRIAGMIGRLPIVGTVAARQMGPDSEIVRALSEAEPVADIVSIWTTGDGVVSREAATLRGARVVRAPVGNRPIGHYQLVVDPRNLAFLLDELAR